MTPVAAGHWAAADLAIPQPDVAIARQLLEQAGWTVGPDGVRQRGDQPLAGIRSRAVHVVIGESGSGKSVLAHTVLDLLPRNVTVRGERHLAGTDLATADRWRWRQLRSRHLAFIPQSPASALNPVRRLGPLMIELARAAECPARPPGLPSLR